MIEQNTAPVVTESIAYEVSDVRWDDFGVPFPVEMYAQGRALADRLSKGEKLAPEELTALQNFNALRARLSYKGKVDPIHFGYTLAGWRKVLEYWEKAKIILIGGGNRSAKSHFMSRVVVKCALDIPNANIRCFHKTMKRSKEDQQAFVYDALPDEYRGVLVRKVPKPKGRNYSVDYRQKSGFSGDKCIIPPIWPVTNKGSIITFNNYKQYINDKGVFEGDKNHLIWCDEDVPFGLFKKLIGRPLTDYHGKLVITYTMLDGYTELVGNLLENAKTLEWRWSERMQKKLPIVQQMTNQPDGYIFNFWTEDNPFIDAEELWKVIKFQSEAEQLTKFYGIPARLNQSKFPKFDLNVHVIDPEKVPTLDVTRYHVVDPGANKNYAMIWAAVDKDSNIYVYREWPDFKRFGEWAQPGAEGSSNQNKGSPGPAQKLLGFGFDDYVQLFKKLENIEAEDHSKREYIFERLIDPRAGNAQRTGDSGTTTLVDEFAQRGIFFKAAVGEDRIDTGLQLINQMLSYDETRPVCDDNKPKLYISRDCGNLISCIQNYTAAGGYAEATKDFVDLLRYLVLAHPIHIGRGFKARKGGFAY